METGSINRCPVSREIAVEIGQALREYALGAKEFHASHLRRGKYYSNHGGFVMEEYLMGFDAAFFGYTELQASLMDPIQRNSLEVGYSVLLKAGWNRERLKDADVGALDAKALKSKAYYQVALHFMFSLSSEFIRINILNPFLEALLVEASTWATVAQTGKRCCSPMPCWKGLVATCWISWLRIRPTWPAPGAG